MPILTPNQFEATLGEIVRRLRHALAPVAIYLFGSYAYGALQRDSDIDVLVVVEDSPDSAYQRDAKACLALVGFPFRSTCRCIRRRNSTSAPR